MTENLDELLVIDEWIKHDIDIETFSAVATPAIALCANIAASKDAEIAWELNEFLDDLVLIHAAKKAEVLDLVAEVSGGIKTKIVFKFNTLRILVVNVRAFYVALICGSFVAEHNVRLVVEISNDKASESEAGREWDVTVSNAMTGKIVYESHTTGASLEIIATEWTPGIYVIKACVANQVLTQKIVVN